ncbi:hypothetical protein FE783_12675 [Paenibacillus mesophilus]|uniref:hypothetical protein n=1 Tax=Paenibacillus mesophilus TaxID=2582849 RepID=UPI00110EB706|nr:hypothetical protein [Paenibacillus mesophilus]TMV49364.1 hypothetical protein FE783_12675 [Paenibacillus mesophilus]
MFQLFDFSDLFADWETDFQRLQKGGGHYDYAHGGKWVPGYGDPIDMQGIVVPFSYAELQFGSGGTYTQDDRVVFVRKPVSLDIDDRIIYDGHEYRVLEQADYTEYANFYAYLAKRVNTKGRDPLAGTGDNP